MEPVPEEEVPQEFVTPSNDAILLKVVRSKEDMLSGNSFKPVFSHQVFGDNESIFGYTGLEINITYSACKLNCLVSTKFDTKFESSEGTPEPDDVYELLKKVIRHPIYSNSDLFMEALEKDQEFTPLGDLVKSFSVEHQGSTRNFDVYYCDSTTKGFPDYLQRLETFLIWFIDAASYIDVSDPRWQFFLLFEKIPCTEANQRYAYCFVGYISVYAYYCYPDLVRPRISQVLVLPPFQKYGLCAHMLSAFYYHYSSQSNIKDITVEAPNTAFQSVRDYVDCVRCADLSCFTKENLIKGYSKSVETEVREKMKIAAKQVHRIFDIMYLKEIVGSDEEKYSQFMERLKRRLILKSQLMDNGGPLQLPVKPEGNGQDNHEDDNENENDDENENEEEEENGDMMMFKRKRKGKKLPANIELSDEAEAEFYEHVKETLFQYKNVIRRLIRFPNDL